MSIRNIEYVSGLYSVNFLLTLRTNLKQDNMAAPFLFELEKGKSAILKKKIISYYINNVTSPIPDLAKELDLSVPTVTKLINEMEAVGIITEQGKISNRGGRRPCIYGLNPASGYFFGMDVRRNHINMGLMNFSGEMMAEYMDVPLCDIGTNKRESIDEISRLADEFIDDCAVDREHILNGCIDMSGRVNPKTGYSYSTFSFSETPISEIFSHKLGFPAVIDNDTRAMTYGEYLKGCANGEKNLLFVNISWGLGLGIVINGSVYEGEYGYAGEIGHVAAFDNEIMCHCGKKGCLETEVSGMALQRRVVESLKEGKNSILSDSFEREGDEAITLRSIIEAVRQEDLLCIDLLEDIGAQLGKWIAGMMNIFNPQTVVIGGTLSGTNDYLLQPVKLAVNKYTLRLVSQGSKIMCSKLGDRAGVIGACLLARNRLLVEND